MNILSSNRLWDEALASRRGFISLRMQIDDVRREVLGALDSKTEFLDKKFTSLFEGQSVRFDELNAKFDTLPRIIAEMMTKKD